MPRGEGSFTPRSIFLPEFRFDLADESLWRGDAQVALRPKAAKVLTALVAHAGELVTRQALVDAVWPEGYVGEAALTVCVSELRRALNDDATCPRYIATVHTRGYRFVAAVSTSPVAADDDEQRAPFVGRDAEVDLLERCWDETRHGRRQVVFVAGDAGLGKSTLLGCLERRVRSDGRVLLGRGHGVEHFGEGEPFLPIFEALADLCHGPGGGLVRDTLGSLAPTWLRQMPALIDPEELAALELRTREGTRGRMLREIADVFDALGVVRPILLVLEDLHDSDPSTAELLSYLARRQRSGALMIVGTYRPVEAAVRAHPLCAVVQDLRGRDQCTYLPLELLPASAVTIYLADRLGPATPSSQLATEIFERTDGNPLFVVRVVDYLAERGLLRAEAGEVRIPDRLDRLGVPGSLRQLIDRQLGRADPADHRLLGAAAVTGVEFATDTVAAALDEGVEDVDVEDRCEQLAADTGLVVRCGVASGPDGTFSSRYRFGHALYQQVLYENLPPLRRCAMHRRVGERLEARYGSRAWEIAGELAMHFERGREERRAVHYLTLAGETALQRRASREALDHTRRALDLLRSCAAGPRRAGNELKLRMTQAAALMAAKGAGAPEVEHAYAEARELCRAVDDPRVLIPAAYSLWYYALRRGHISAAGELVLYIEALVRQGGPGFSLELQALNARAVTHLFAGEPAAAQPFIERAMAMYDPAAHGRLASYYEDPGVLCRTYAAFAAWLLGYPDRARRFADDALRRAELLVVPGGICQALWPVGVVYQLCGDLARVHDLSDELLRVARQHELPVWSAAAQILDGWVAVRRGAPHGALARIDDGLAVLDATGVAVMRPYQLGLRAEALAGLGLASGALETVTMALGAVERTGDRWYEADLLRRRGDLELALARASRSRADRRQHELAAEHALRDAIAVAQHQQAKSMELRAATSLARLLAGRSQPDEAREVLSEIHEWFDEGFDTADLGTARDLLTELGDVRVTSAVIDSTVRRPPDC